MVTEGQKRVVCDLEVVGAVADWLVGLPLDACADHLVMALLVHSHPAPIPAQVALLAHTPGECE